jgi:hypothetical protein
LSTTKGANLAETLENIETLKKNKNRREAECEILQRLTLGPASFDKLTESNRTLERALHDLVEKQVVQKRQGHFGVYFLAGYEEGTPSFGTQITIAKSALTHYQALGWRFVSSLGDQDIILEYHPPIKISHLGY